MPIATPRIVLALLLILTPRVIAGDVLPREKIDALVRPAIDEHWSNSLVVGLINARDRQTLGYGAVTDGKSDPPDGQTIFEIGSISKTFTGLLLADAITRGQMGLDDPAGKYLPQGVKMPAGAEGKPITLLHLATHSSGLPRMPSNFTPADPGNPYADYTLQQMYDYLTALKLQREPGEKCVYSNTGVALLGNLLARRAEKTYEQLLIEKIVAPLEMNSTRITLDDAMKKRLAPGHDVDGFPQKNWDLPAFAGAGGIRSDADDMLTYLAAELGMHSQGLGPAMKLARQPRREFDANNQIGLCWLIDEKDGYCWHNGQTGGYHCFAAFERKKRVGVVVLSNTAGDIPDIVGVALMRTLLGQNVPPPKLPKIVALTPEQLDRYVGTYRLDALVNIRVFRRGDRLIAQLTGQGSAVIYPESETQFFWKAVQARATFEIDPAGKVSGLTLHQYGRDLRAEKVK